MSRSNIEDAKSSGLFHSGDRWATMDQSISADYNIKASGPGFLLFDPLGGARTVFLPPIPAGGGLKYHIGNKGAAGTLAIRTDAGVLLVTLNPLQVAIFVSGQTSWLFILTSGNIVSVDVPDGDKGDITVTGAGSAWTIDPGVVTNAKMANMGAATLKGSVAGGVPADLTATQATSILNTFTSGLKGLVPASGGGSTLFLNANGGFTVPPSSYTDENAQDAVGSILLNTATINFTYDDPTPNISASVNDNSIIYTKMQDVSAASRLLGRGSAAGAGDPQEISLGTNISMSGTTLNVTGLTDGDKTDITGSGGVTVLTIDPDVVTYAKMQNISAASLLLGRGSAAGAGDPQEIVLGTNLSMSGTTLNATGGGAGVTDGDQGDITVSGVGTVWTVDPNTITLAKMQTVNTDTLLGRDTAGVGNVEQLSVGGGVEFTGAVGIQRSALTGDVTAPAGSNATTIAANAVATAKIADNAVTYAKIQDVSATARLLGRITAGAGDPEELTGTQATTLLDAFTSLLKGLVPPSGGGTTGFLRADGAFTVPPGIGTVGNRTVLVADTDYFVRKNLGTATVTIASPAVVSKTAHGLSVNDRVVFSRPGDGGIITATIASPCVVTKTAHGLSANDPIAFTSTGLLPTGFPAQGTTVFVNIIDANTFKFALTSGGADVNTSGTQSGEHHVIRKSTLPTGIVEGTAYFVISAGFGANAFQFSLTLGGAAVNTSGTQSGKFTIATGSDTADGLTANTSWLTLQHADDVLGKTVDIATFKARVNCADSTYFVIVNFTGYYTSGGTTISSPPGIGYVGNTSVPSNVNILGEGTQGLCYGIFTPNFNYLDIAFGAGMRMYPSGNSAVWAEPFFVGAAPAAHVNVGVDPINFAQLPMELGAGNSFTDTLSGNIEDSSSTFLIDCGNMGTPGVAMHMQSIMDDGAESAQGLANLSVFSVWNVTGGPFFDRGFFWFQQGGFMRTIGWTVNGIVTSTTAPFRLDNLAVINTKDWWNFGTTGGTTLPLIANGSIARSGGTSLTGFGGVIVGSNMNHPPPITGFSMTLGNYDSEVILDPAGTLATGTITMCPNVLNNMRVTIRTSQTITALTFSPNSGQSVVGAPSTLAAGKSVTALFKGSNSTWYFG